MPISPLAFFEDATQKDAWHIVIGDAAVCGAPLGNVEYLLPDSAFLTMSICLDCWERIAVVLPMTLGALSVSDGDEFVRQVVKRARELADAG